MRGYRGFTLIEMFLILAVITIITSISARVFVNLRASNAVNEVALTITQDIRDTQRAAMMLEREQDDRWIYGIGIDFTRMTSSTPSYTIFKYCARENFFDPANTRHVSNIPANVAGNVINPNLRVRFNDSTEHRDSCGMNTDVHNLGSRENLRTRTFEDYPYLDFSFIDPGFSQIRYVLFQSVTGKAFLYRHLNSGPRLVNHTNSEPFSLNVSVHPLRLVVGGNVGPDRIIRIFPVSGITHVDNLIVR